jgi:type IV fimbrial biogenesis protein FimT
MLIMSQRGVTLIELVIGIAIVSILLMMGVPAFNLWIQTTQNRTAAESILNGLQLARAESVRRNAIVRFNLIDATGLVEWEVGCVTATADCPAKIQSRPAKEGSVQARVGISTDATQAGNFGKPIPVGEGLTAGVSFNGLGRVPDVNVGTDITRIDITNAATTAVRRFVVIIGTGGQIRMCDPALVFAQNPQGCS